MRNVWRVLLFFAVSGLVPAFAADNHIAVDFWGLSYHGNRDRNYNEQNWGLGLRAYHGKWFVAADRMKNSSRGQTTAFGVGYEYPFANVRGYVFSVAAEVARVNYEFPGRGTAHGTLIIPFLSVRKDALGGNVALIPPNGRRKAILLFSATYHFKAF
ncbi:MAG: hypothetical protein NUV60_03515 [Patescibacteria group bacterium]|nr:hypothetical protein [Patescibacteria group bacterium]